jgi:hypothetical protein
VTGGNCDEIRADAAELALGVLDGEQRARALEHARGCERCRDELAEFAIVAERILVVAPEHEPPPGFESRVLDALPQTRRRARRFGRLVPALAAAVLVTAAVTASLTLSLTSEERRLGERYGAVLETAGGKYLAARHLRDAAGAKSGVVFAYQGDQPWITVVLSPTVGAERWSVAITTRDGRRRVLGTFDAATTGRVWGRALQDSVPDLASVRLTGSRGGDLQARIAR